MLIAVAIVSFVGFYLMSLVVFSIDSMPTNHFARDIVVPAGIVGVVASVVTTLLVAIAGLVA